jgi:hypothetical protein
MAAAAVQQTRRRSGQFLGAMGDYERRGEFFPAVKYYILVSFK